MTLLERIWNCVYGFKPINASIALTSPFSKSPEDIRSGDEVINTSFANVIEVSDY